MTVTAYSRGQQVFYTNDKWRYADDTPMDKHRNPCVRCGKSPTPEGYDACLGYIPGVISACCGHGVETPYIIFEEGVIK